MFSVALQSVDKAKLGFENQSNSIMAMRNFLQNSFWGYLLELARKNQPIEWRCYQKNKVSQPDTQNPF